MPEIEKAVLVVEDNKTLRFLVMRQLTRLGLRCDLASDGAEAVSKAAAHKYDLILMDIQMPNMNGLEAARSIRAHEADDKNFATPIVAVTANPNSRQCFEAGINDFLFKPVSLNQLDETVKRWLFEPTTEITAPQH